MSPEGMYGGLQTITSKSHSTGSGFSFASASMQVTLAFRSLRRTFCLQIFSASSLKSASTTRQAGTLAATARPTQPLPAHKSSTRAPSPAARARRMARSASSSVSMRGISTFRSISRLSP